VLTQKERFDEKSYGKVQALRQLPYSCEVQSSRKMPQVRLLRQKVTASLTAKAYTLE
jgi:hypothetical protein